MVHQGSQTAKSGIYRRGRLALSGARSGEILLATSWEAVRHALLRLDRPAGGSRTTRRSKSREDWFGVDWNSMQCHRTHADSWMRKNARDGVRSGRASLDPIQWATMWAGS